MRLVKGGKGESPHKVVSQTFHGGQPALESRQNVANGRYWRRAEFPKTPASSSMPHATFQANRETQGIDSSDADTPDKIEKRVDADEPAGLARLAAKWLGAS